MADAPMHFAAHVAVHTESYGAYLIGRYGNPMRRAIIRAGHRSAAARRADRPRLGRMRSAYRAKTRGRSRRG